MKAKPQLPLRFSGASVALGLTLSAFLAGCVSESEPRYGGTWRRPVQVIQQPAYIYYPDYELYYNVGSREYVYFDGRGWVSGRYPPRWAQDLRGAAYVQLDFNDSPIRHHQDVVRRYPRHWRRDRDQYGSRDRDDLPPWQR